MHEHHRKRREPVTHRGQRVPNLSSRPKPASDHREGDTFEVIFRDETGRQRQKTLKARTVERAVAEAEEYRTQIRRGEVMTPSRLKFCEVAEEYLGITEALVATGERSQRTVDLYRQRFDKHISPVIGHRQLQEVRPEHIGGDLRSAAQRGAQAVDDLRNTDGHLSDPQLRPLPELHRHEPA